MPTTKLIEPDFGISARPATDQSVIARSNESPYPVLRTRQFQFRPFVLADIAPLVALASERRIADTSIGVPHPYTPEFARMWISSHPEEWKTCRALHWAAVKVDDHHIVGYAGLHNVDMDRRQTELRFWVGCGVERNRHAIEWCSAIIDFARTTLGMNRVYALQLDRHRLVGRVLSAIGMKPEGFLRKRIIKGGLMEDMTCWAIVRKVNSNQHQHSW